MGGHKMTKTTHVLYQGWTFRATTSHSGNQGRESMIAWKSFNTPSVNGWDDGMKAVRGWNQMEWKLEWKQLEDGNENGGCLTLCRHCLKLPPFNGRVCWSLLSLLKCAYTPGWTHEVVSCLQCWWGWGNCSGLVLSYWLWVWTKRQYFRVEVIFRCPPDIRYSMQVMTFSIASKKCWNMFFYG